VHSTALAVGELARTGTNTGTCTCNPRKENLKHNNMSEYSSLGANVYYRGTVALGRICWFYAIWSTWSAVGNLTSRAEELRSALSGPDDSIFFFSVPVLVPVRASPVPK